MSSGVVVATTASDELSSSLPHAASDKTSADAAREARRDEVRVWFTHAQVAS